MTDLIVVPQAAHWQRLKRLVLEASPRQSPAASIVSGSTSFSRGTSANPGPASLRRPSLPGALRWKPSGLERARKQMEPAGASS